MAQDKLAAIGDTVYFHFGSNDTAGSGADGADPVFDVRLCGAAADAAPVLSAGATLLTNAAYPDGAHEVEIAATEENGFAAGSEYAVFATLAVDGENPTGMIGSFRLVAGGSALESTAQVNAEADQALTDYDPPTAAEMDAAIAGLDVLLDRALGLGHENAYMDSVVVDGDGRMTSARLRTYNSAANAQAHGAEGLVATYTISVTYLGANEAPDTYLMVRA